MNHFEEIEQRLKYSHNEMPKCPHCDKDIDPSKHELNEYDTQSEKNHLVCDAKR